MADDTSASIVQLHKPAKPKTAAERAKAYRDRKKQKKDRLPLGVKALPAHNVPRHIDAEPCPALRADEVLIDVERPRAGLQARLLQVAAFGLAAVGVTMNGWFARSLGSSEIAGWLFLAIGVAADLVALAVPSCAAQQWHAGNRVTALVAWVLWLMPFAFAVTAGIGFASVNISDVTLQRASRVTPAIENARNDLRDAVTARDRECAGGVGKFCRQREDAVSERRRLLDDAMRSVEHAADPQTEAATRMVSWFSGGMVKPTGDDFAMLRLLLLAFLPQLGGVLLMVGAPANLPNFDCAGPAR